MSQLRDALNNGLALTIPLNRETIISDILATISNAGFCIVEKNLLQEWIDSSWTVIGQKHPYQILFDALRSKTQAALDGKKETDASG